LLQKSKTDLHKTVKRPCNPSSRHIRRVTATLAKMYVAYNINIHFISLATVCMPYIGTPNLN